MSLSTMRYLGWSNIVIKGKEGDLVFDPFYRKMYGADWAKPEDYDNVQVICVSHGHHEHYLDAPIIAKRTGATIVSSPEVCDHLQSKHGIPGVQLRPVLPYEEVKVSGFTIVPFDWHHRPINYLNFFKGSPTAAFNFISNNILRSPWKARYYGFIVKTQSGQCLLNLTEGMNPLFSDGELDVLKQRFSPDVLIGGHQLVYEDDVARCVKNTGVKKCVLYHPHEKLFGQMNIASTHRDMVRDVVQKAAPEVEILMPKPMETLEV